jgi:hypothetical protein
MFCISTSDSPANCKQKVKIDCIRWIDARHMKVGLNKNFKNLKLIQELHLKEGLALLWLQIASSSTLLTTWTLVARVQGLIDCLKIYSEKTTIESINFCYYVLRQDNIIPARFDGSGSTTEGVLSWQPLFPSGQNCAFQLRWGDNHVLVFTVSGWKELLINCKSGKNGLQIDSVFLDQLWTLAHFLPECFSWLLPPW